VEKGNPFLLFFILKGISKKETDKGSRHVATNEQDILTAIVHIRPTPDF